MRIDVYKRQVGGYYVADLVLYRDGAIADIPANAIQAVGSAVAVSYTHLILLFQSTHSLYDKWRFIFARLLLRLC